MPSPLQSILEPVTVRSWVTEYHGQRPLHVPGRPGKFHSLFNYASLNEVLNRSPSPHPNLKLAVSGKSVLPKDTDRVLHGLRDGATLILEDIDRYDARLGSFLDELSAEIGSTTRFNLYLSSPDQQGYKLHYDTHAFFILHLAGFKKWRIFPNTVDSPLFFQAGHDLVPPHDNSIVLEINLAPGDVLYVPRGFWHDAVAMDESSLHLTLAIFERTGIDFLSWLVNELRESPEARAALPLRFASDVDMAPEATARHFRSLRQILLAKFDDATTPDDYDRYHAVRYKGHAPYHLPHQLAPAHAARHVTVFRRPPLPHHLRFADDVQLACEGRIATFDRRTESLLRFIFSVTSFSRDEAAANASGLHVEAVTDVLRVLVSEGWIIPAGESHD